MMNWIKTAFKGMGMGIAEVIPGVSGGTIAFITGIYEKLLVSIKQIDKEFFQLLFSGKLLQAFAKVNGGFLLKVLTGMVVGFVVGLFVVTYLLEHYPIHIWSLFFGLIIASVYVVYKEIPRWNLKEVVALIAGTVFVYFITVSSPSSSDPTIFMLFISGVLGISALILPGLSGSFVLLLLGMYTVVMPAIKDVLRDFSPEALKIVGVFAIGALVGLFSFAHLLTWLYKNHRSITMATLTGFLIGSLNKVWPWQEVLSTRVNSKGETVVMYSKSVLPGHLKSLEVNFSYGTEPHLFAAIGLMLLGVVLVLLLDRFSLEEDA
jgi:putative membrane protein